MAFGGTWLLAERENPLHGAYIPKPGIEPGIFGLVVGRATIRPYGQVAKWPAFKRPK